MNGPVPTVVKRAVVFVQSSLRARSLRVQLTIWSFLFTFASLSVCAILLWAYLSFALSSSRTESMLKRDQRLMRFLRSDVSSAPAADLRPAMQHFLEATPENDLVKISDATTGDLLYASSDSLQWLRGKADSCLQPCLTTVLWKNHHFRVLTHSTDLNGRRLRITLAGSIDEHYGILRSVGAGFLALIPLILVGSILGGHSLARRALIPVGHMTAQARHMEVADLRSRIEVPQTQDELQDLALAWNDMLGRLQVSTTRISQFAADASHDLRTSLTVMLANAEIALRRERSPERYQGALQTIANESQRMLEMIDGLLLTANAGWKQEALKRDVIDVGELLREVYDAHHAAAAMRQQTLCLDSPTGMPLLVEADRALLARLVNILVDNAIKYTHEGGRIALRIGTDRRGACVEVSDNGCGIPAEMQERVFERLVRGSYERTNGTRDGYGLGLSIARWIAERHGFPLELVSAPNRGSTFRLVLSIAD